MAIVNHLLERMPDVRILLMQFNQDACRMMRAKLPLSVDVYTIHAFAMRLITAPFQVDPNKLFRKWSNYRSTGPDALREWQTVRDFVHHVRNRGWIPDFNEHRPLTLAMSLLEDMVTDRLSVRETVVHVPIPVRDVLDTEDALYHCLYHGCKTPNYDVILIDEAQRQVVVLWMGERPGLPDLNEANVSFVKQCLGSKTVVCAVGDPAQSIYAFRGANPSSMQYIQRVLDAQIMRISRCFRCPQTVVNLAAHLNPHIQPDDSQKQDVIRSEASPKARRGQVVVCTSSHP